MNPFISCIVTTVYLLLEEKKLKKQKIFWLIFVWISVFCAYLFWASAGKHANRL